MTRTNHLALLLPLLVCACDSPEQESADDLSDDFRMATTAGAPVPELQLLAAWTDTFDRAFGRYQSLFGRAGSDAGVQTVIDRWSTVEGFDVLGAWGPISPAPPSGPKDKWSPSDPAPADLNVCDRPPAGRPTFNQCDAGERERISVAWDRAHYGTWRALQRLHWVLETPDDAEAALRWSRQAPNAGSSPQHWFGPFSRSRAEVIRKTMEKAWAQLSMDEEIQINCWRAPTWWEALFVPLKLGVYMKSPCSVKAAMAHSIWVGHPPLNAWVDDPAYEVCESFFEYGEDDGVNPDEEDLNFLGGVFIHEMLHFAVTPNCGGFPDSTCGSVGVPPPYRPFLPTDLGITKDSFSDAACDILEPKGKCYGTDEAEALAIENPDHAARLPSAYQHFAEYTADMYRLGRCTNGMNKCFPVDEQAPGCDHLECGPPPAGENCEPGTPGCGCIDVDIFQHDDLLDDGGRADGAGSFLSGAEEGQYCPGSDVVCGSVTSSACGAQPVCQTCNEDTMVGCGCDDDADCTAANASNLRCWGGANAGWPQAPSGSGICLPSDGTPQGRDELEEMPWFCLENCVAVEQWSGQTACVYNQGGYAFDHGTCMHLGTCENGSLDPGECEASGLLCDGSDACTPKCETNADCTALQFPNDYVCADFGDTSACVPPMCGGGDALGYCGLHAPQQ